MKATLFSRWKKWAGVVVIIIAAVLMEALLAFQYNYARNQLEAELERSTLLDLITSSLRIQEVLSRAEVAVHDELAHIERHLSEPDYMFTIVRNLVSNNGDNLDGAFMCFQPHFFPQKGYWFEPYARNDNDSICLFQMGSQQHDYSTRKFFQNAMNGAVTLWTDPYWDGEGAHNWVITYVAPIMQNGKPVGALGVDLTTPWINGVVNHFHPHPSSFTMVLTKDGKLVVAPPDSVASGTLVAQIVSMCNDSTVERKLVGRGHIVRFKFYDPECDEYGRVYYAVRPRSPEWQMLLVCYDSEVFGELEKLRRYMLYLALIALAVLGIIIWLFIRDNRKLQFTQLRQERLNSELRIAAEIQREMLPKSNQLLDPEGHSYFEIYGSLVPAREVGGDLYDFFVRDEKLFFAIGDVSGKGVPSAMLMAVIHSLFRSASAHENNPARIMTTINEASAQGNDRNMFVTLFIGVLDLPTGHLRYSNAGHDCPFLILNHKSQMMDCDSNLPVGAFGDTKYTLQEITIPADTTVFLYTDGLTEAKNKQHDQFSLKRVEQLMTECAKDSLPPKLLLDKATESVHAFVAEAEQSDDLTMLAIHYDPARFNTTLVETLTLQNRVSEIKRFSTFIKAIVQQLNIEPALAGKLRLAIEEAVVNVIDYAYPSDTKGDVDIEVLSDGNVLKVIIRDSGGAFDPTAKEKADTSLSAEDRQIGGLGLLLVRELMDSINYERINGKNVLTLIKKI